VVTVVRTESLYGPLSTKVPVPVAVRSKAHMVFDGSKIGIVGSNLARGMDVCSRFSILCRTVQVDVLRWADPLSEESYEK
jgi:hypothetical protein